MLLGKSQAQNYQSNFFSSLDVEDRVREWCIKRKRDERKEERKQSPWKVLKEVVYGMFAHGHISSAVRFKMYHEHLFMLITLGDILGIPVLPPYYSLKILPTPSPTSVNGKGGMRGKRAGFDKMLKALATALLKNLMCIRFRKESRCER